MTVGAEDGLGIESCGWFSERKQLVALNPRLRPPDVSADVTFLFAASSSHVLHVVHQQGILEGNYNEFS